MALTKSNVNLNTDTVLTGGAGPTVGGWQDISLAYFVAVHVKILNGSGISTPAKFRIEVAGNSGAGKNYELTPRYEMSTANGAEYSSVIEIPPSENAFRLVVDHAIGGNVTLNAEFTKTTAI